VAPSPIVRGGVLDHLLRPRSVAMIGASNNPNALGGRPIGFLASYDFAGTVYPVNATRDEVQGRKAYRSILDVPEAVDVALVAVRAALTPQVLRECRTAGVGMAVVMSSGLGEGQGGGAELAAEIAEIAEVGAEGGMRLLGPNCEGIASLPGRAPLTFSPSLDVARTGNVIHPGPVAVVSQSGGMGFAVAQWGTEVGLGFNYILSTGNEMDVDALEITRELVELDDVSTVVLLAEGFKDPAQFPAIAARTAELGKHLIVAKLGHTAPGSRGAYAHTRHDAGDPDSYRGLFAAPAVHQVSDEEELIDVLQALVKAPAARSPRLGVMTTSGGAGVWLSDACADRGFEIAELTGATQRKLSAHMPGYGSPVNPVDMTAQFIAGGAFAPAMQVLLESGEIDAVVLATSLSSAGRLEEDREALKTLFARFPEIPVAVYTYTKPAPSCVDILRDLDIPWYTGAARAARGMAALLRASGPADEDKGRWR
jgi:acyl-CoA synthetase (NDP forming)